MFPEPNLRSGQSRAATRIHLPRHLPGYNRKGSSDLKNGFVCVPAFLRLRQVTKAFNVFDRDGSGAIDRHEFSLAVRIALTPASACASRPAHRSRPMCRPL